MAGPTSSILLESIPDESTLIEIRRVIEKISNKVEQDDFWIASTKSIGGTVNAKGQPFGIEKKPVDLDYSNEELSLICQHIGFKPKFDLGNYAMCNGAIDHRLLGELTCYFANKFGGVIDFGGAIFPRQSLPEKFKKGMWLWEEANWSDIQPYFDKMVENIDGNIYTIEYETASRRNWVYHVCDVEFMKNWLKNSNFHMIK